MNNTNITFTTPGRPYPQGSKRHIGNGRLIESCKQVGPWRERVAITAHNTQQHDGTTITNNAVTVTIEFVLPRPKTTPKTRTPPATKRPDIDKLVRAALDAISGIIIQDDSQVTELHATKRLAQPDETPHTTITVTTTTQD